MKSLTPLCNNCLRADQDSVKTLHAQTDGTRAGEADAGNTDTTDASKETVQEPHADRKLNILQR